MFAHTLSRYWWILLVRGIIAILFGFAAFMMPGVTLVTLVLCFAAFAFADGIFNVAHALAGRKGNEHWGVLLLEGALGIVFGILTFTAPGITTFVLLVYIAAWAIVTGVMRIILAIRLRQEIEGEWMLALSGVISLFFGLLMLTRPDAGALAVIWYIGAWAILMGAFFITLAFSARGFGQKLIGAGKTSRAAA